MEKIVFNITRSTVREVIDWNEVFQNTGLDTTVLSSIMDMNKEGYTKLRDKIEETNDDSFAGFVSSLDHLIGLHIS